MIQVFHFSPVARLSRLVPKLPSNSQYADHAAVYLALSLEQCHFWADVMAREGYHHPPFYFYQGWVEMAGLRQLRAIDDDCTQFELAPVSLGDLEELDQVLAIAPVDVIPIFDHKTYCAVQ